MSKRENRNPFQIGKPIQDAVDFYGRHELISNLVRNLVEFTSVSIVGERRTGKTSILLYLSQSDMHFYFGLPENHIPIYIDFQNFADSDKESIFEFLAYSISEELLRRDKENQTNVFEAIAPDIAVLSNYPRITHLHRVIRTLQNNNVFLHFLLDEFELVGENPNLGSDFFGNLRALAIRHKFSYVVASSKTIDKIEQPKGSSPFFNIFSNQYLPLFNEEEVFHLIVGSFTQNNISVSLEKRLLQAKEQLWSISDIILDITGFHPYFVQMLCHHLYAKRDISDWPEGLAMFEALIEFAEDVEAIFNDYWSRSDQDEKEILTKLALNEPIIWSGNYERTREKLQKRCLVKPIEDSESWRIFSSFFAQWIKSGGSLEKNYIEDYVYNIAGKGKRKRKHLHLFTGSKGGVGKTLLALSTASKYLDQEKVLCIDLNWENADLSRIIQLNEEIDVSGKLKYAFASILDGNGLIMRPTTMHNIPSAAIGFWNEIRVALRESYENHKFDPDVVVVDTNLHFASLLRQSSDFTIANVLKRIDTIVRESQIEQLNIWYIWTLASMHEKSGDPANITTVLQFMKDALHEKYFDPKNNFIHVLNSYALYPTVFIDGLEDEEKTLSIKNNIEALDAIAKAPIADGIDVVDLLESMNRDENEFIWNSPHADKIEQLGINLLNNLKGRRPRNMCVIPVYDRRVIGYTDFFIGQSTISIDDIVDSTASVQEYIHSFLDHLTSK